MTDSEAEAPAPAAPPSSNVLDDALARVGALNPALAQTLRREVEALRDGRAFGLVFERHLPESVRLPEHPIKRGVQVGLRAPTKDEQKLRWRVVRLSGTGADRVAHLDDETSRPVADLAVVRDFGEPIYPGLRRVDRIANGPEDAPWHVIINGENHHVLQALRMTHREKVDLIYIDPPYNTGNNGWIYNDRYVAEKDAYKHSKWLSFIERRLTIARDLLKDTGVIFVAIGDDEQHRLRMLLDQVFGTQNFISNIVWQGGRKNDSRHVSNGADYMLAYAKDLSTWTVQGYKVKDSPDVNTLTASQIPEHGARWWGGKPGAEQALAAAKEIWEETSGNHAEATKKWRAWMREFKKEGIASDAVTRFTTLHLDGRPIRTDGNLTSPNPRENLQYDLLHPATGRPAKMPEKGWRYSKDVMANLVERGLIRFGKDHTTTAYEVVFLETMDRQVAESVFVRDRNQSSEHLEDVLGDKRFPNPKDANVLMSWLRLATPKDAVILDFFGGSGTTTEAVMRLNHEDDSTRQSILVTNNEVSAKDATALKKGGYVPGDKAWEAKGVFKYVTRPRVTTVVTGKRPDGSAYSDGLAANVEFFDLVYLDETRIERAREYEAIASLLWLWGGSRGEYPVKEPADGWAIADAFAVLVDVDHAELFLTRLGGMEHPPTLVFVVTDSPSDFDAISNRLPRGCRPVRLYEAYMRNFEINTGDLP